MNRPLSTLCLVAAVDMVGYGAVLPLLPFLATRLQASPLMVTAIIVAFPFAQLMVSPILGGLSDRFGRRRVIAFGMVAAAVSYAIFAVSQNVACLFLSRVVAGSAGATYAVAQAYVADVTAPEDRAAGMGWLGASYGVGLVLGPVLGAAMVRYGYFLPGLAAAALCTLNAGAAWFFLPAIAATGQESAPRLLIGGRLALLATRPLPGLFSIYTLCIGAFEAVMAILALYLAKMARVDAVQAGLLWAMAGVVTIAVRAGLVGRLSAALGERRVIQAGIALLAATMVGLSQVDSFGSALVAISLLSAGAGLVFPSLASLTSKAAPPAHRGLVMGSNQVLGSGGKIIGPLVSGLLFETMRATTPLWGAASVLLLALAMSFRILARTGEHTRS